ncbi:MAG: ABC transporter substrate-binding protein, partial [Anaerolineae bacterium]
TAPQTMNPSANLLFVGREEEHAKLVSAWEATRQGRGQLTLVEGEAGVGKTRLLDEVLRYAKTQGAKVLRGRCYEFGGSVPYQPIAEALRVYFDDEHLKLSPIWLVELARLLPDLHERYPDLPEPQRTTGETARQRLFEAVARLLFSARDVRAPQCLLLDDLHWADQSTLDLLHYLVRHLDKAIIWLVGTYRPEEVGLSHPLTRLRQGLSRDHQLTRLTLKPLSGEAVSTLAHTLVGERDSVILSDLLYRESEGNAFILVETVNALQEEGALVRSKAHAQHDEHGIPAWAWTGAPPEETLPLTVQDIVLQRVGRLSENAQHLLTLAAVVGQPFDLPLLSDATTENTDSIEKSLDEWLARRLIAAQPPTSSIQQPAPNIQYDFSHDKIRTVIYHTTEPGQRQRLHHCVAEALEQRFASRIEEHVASLAYHWEQAGELEKAADYLVLAGDQARQVYAHQEAIDYYRRALALLETQENTRREEQARTLMKLGLAYHHAFDYRSSRQAYEASFELWQQTGKKHLTAPLPPAPHPLHVRWLEPTTLDPAMSPDNHTSCMLMQLFSGLVTLSPKMNIMPDVAYAWEVSEDGRQYVFYLRDDARWSDGVPVTAHDFEYAWKRALDPTTTTFAADFLYDLQGARAFHQGEGNWDTVGVHAVDEGTLIVTLEEPTGYFMQLLVRPDYFPVPRHVVEKHGAAWTEPAHFVTNGPFRLDRWDRGKRVILARNPDYHGRFGGNVERVEAHPIMDWSIRMQMYEEDALDLLGITFCPPEKRLVMQAQYADQYIAVPDLETCYLVFDVNRPPFNDVRVRRAFALATDRKTLAEKVLEGYAAPAAGGLLPHGMPGHNPDIGPPYDPDEARRLLVEAGYPDGQGFPTLDALAFDAAETRVAYLQSLWRKNLGMEITWQTPKWTTFVDRLKHESHHLVCAMWVADYPDPDNFLRVSRAEVWPGWHNTRYEQLVTEAGRVMDQGKRIDLYRQADEILVNEVPILPLTYEREHLLIKPWVREYPITPSGIVFWKDVILEAHGT